MYMIQLQCIKCGYKWYQRIQIPSICPNPQCRTLNWNKDKLLKKIEWHKNQIEKMQVIINRL